MSTVNGTQNVWYMTDVYIWGLDIMYIRVVCGFRSYNTIHRQLITII
jgi:hypothetical protein